MLKIVNFNEEHNFNTKAHFNLFPLLLACDIGDINFRPLLHHEDGGVGVVDCFFHGHEILLIPIFGSVVLDVDPKLVFIIEDLQNLYIFRLVANMGVNIQALHQQISL